MIAEQKIAEVRQAAKISDFISAYVSLKRSGRGLIGLCPFHGEKTPSFSVSDEGGFFHCFGCGAGGNVFKFVMQMENLAFPEAVRKVASHYGIDVPDEGGSAATSERDAASAMLASAAKFYRACLERAGFGDTVRAYLDERGIVEASRERFFVGAAPAGGDALATFLRREKHDLQLGERIGLVGLRGGSAYDRFRGRLMFPIRDAQGRTLGFGARRIGEGEGPKYLNSSDSQAYHKGRVLYGLFEAREAERRKPASAEDGAATVAAAPASGGATSRELILVEGYLDVIAMSQAGITNVVAGCGTALTVDQARLMRRYCDDVVALFDGDDAGRRAAARSFPLFVEAGLWARAVFLPDGEDPDTFVRSQRASALRSAVATARPLVEAYARYVSQAAGGAGGAARAGAELAEVLRKVANPFEYDDFVKKAALWTGISEQVLRQQGRPVQKAPVSGAGPVTILASGPPGVDELLVTVMLADPGCIDRLEGRDIVAQLHAEPWATIAADIFTARATVGGFVPGEILAGLEDGLRGRLVRRLQDDPAFAEDEARERVLADCLGRLDAEASEVRRRSMLAELRRLEQIGDEAGAAVVLERWNRMKGAKSR
ncbi:MAG TPA: DNA primase [Candidatus Binatia bacterium]|jgi:DNA primase